MQAVATVSKPLLSLFLDFPSRVCTCVCVPSIIWISQLMATRIQGIRKSQVTSLFHFDIIALWFHIAIYRHFDMIAIWFLTPKTAFIVALCNFSAFISHQLTLFNFLRDEFYKSWERKHLFSRENRNHLHKKCFHYFLNIFSIVAHSDEYLHILLNIYLFIIYLNIYLFIIYIFNPCRWRRQ